MRATPVIRAVARRLLPSTSTEITLARSAVLNMFITDTILARAGIVKENRVSPEQESNLRGALQMQFQAKDRAYKLAREELVQCGQQLRDLGSALLERPDDFRTSFEVSGTRLVVSTADLGLVAVEPYPNLEAILCKRDELRQLRRDVDGLHERLNALI